MAKNITLAIDEALLDQARIYAATRKTTVNRLVRDLLAQAIDEDGRLAERRQRLKALMDKSTLELGPDFKWNRDEIYADRLLPGHQRPHLRGGDEG